MVALYSGGATIQRLRIRPSLKRPFEVDVADDYGLALGQTHGERQRRLPPARRGADPLHPRAKRRAEFLFLAEPC